jgi:hypothetical protein
MVLVIFVRIRLDYTPNPNDVIYFLKYMI